MADIFISYKREDFLLAKDLAKKLIELGWSVWWDRNIPVGKAYDQVIEQELAISKCIIVLWSSHSVTSLNVKEEALEGLRRNVLIPIALGKVSPPYGFKMIQTLSWNENLELEDKELDELVDQVQRLLGNPPSGGRKSVPENISDNNVAEQRSNNDIGQRNDTQKQSRLSTLRFIRRNKLIGMTASIKIYIDGEKAASLSGDETFTFSVAPGHHHLRLSGTGSFFDTEEKITIGSSETLSWEVSYSMTGGIKLSRI